ncbi:MULTISPECIES: RNA polymerase sigma factor SigZ [Antarcticibacterium]|uniref:RNA polymerase sigma factor SigZ n=1 Tax=Antarcticibacterium TaxID=2058174 RepID=UPI00143D15CA|nr:MULTISPECIES: RNA polymerase sigma factor SigZ [Antarcticibacterium]
MPPALASCDVPAIWLSHKKELYNYIFKRVKDRELAEDILQEVLLKVYNFCLSKSGVRNLRSWLFQIAQNTIMDHYRKSSKFQDRDIPDVAAEEENMAFKEAVNFIEPMLGFLPEEYAVPLKMADIDGLKQAEIACKLGLSLPATKSRIQRARQLLKAEFITCCNFETDAQGNLVSFDIKATCAPLISYRKKNF